MTDSPEPQPVDPALVKYLRILVTVLTVTMIVGFLVIVVLFVTRFPGAFGPKLPDEITLPEGATATAFTRGDNWFAIVTEDDRILIYDLAGTVLQEVTIRTGR